MLPIYNEAESVGDVIHDIVDTLCAAEIPFEIIAINDGSRDDTQEVLNSLQIEYPQHLRVARHVVNKGYGAAWRTGVRLARGKLLVSMDSDGQHVAAEIPRMVRMIPPGDMVVGARTSEYGGKWYRNLANRMFNRMASWLTEKPIMDLTSGFRVMRREVVLHYIDLFPLGFTMVPAITMILLKAGYNVAYVPVEVRARTHGQSTVNLLRDGREFFWIILKMAMLFDSMRIFVPIAVLFSLLGLLAMGLGAWSSSRLVVPSSAVILFVAAALTLLIGLVSSQSANGVIRYYGDEYIELIEPSPRAGDDD